MAAPEMGIWRNKISGKRYRCSACGAVFRTDTNHWGTIYRGCRHHFYGATADCVEAEEAIKDLTRRET